MNLKVKLFILVGCTICLLLGLAFSIFFVRQQATDQAISTQKLAYSQIILTKEAQVHFKKQVQEWKNLLLRGQNEDDFVTYLSQFVEQEQLTQIKIHELIDTLDPNSSALEMASKFKLYHQQLTEEYRKALVLFNDTAEGSVAVDAKVRGVDRKPTNLLDEIASEVKKNKEQALVNMQITLVRTQWLIIVLIILTAIISCVLIIVLANKLAEELTKDPITGLSNRREMLRIMRRYIKQNRHAHLLLIDIDQFKLINEVCGHSGGDKFLNEIAQQLQLSTRKHDRLFRSNADEFVVISDRLCADQAVEVAQRIRQSINSVRFEWQESYFSASASVAIVAINKRYSDIESVFNSIDIALQNAKESGRDQVIVYDRDNPTLAEYQRKMRMVHQVNYALANNRFILYKQKIAAIKSGEKGHNEILIRMLDDDDNVVPPGLFLPAAEKYNIIGKVDKWVVQQAIKYLNHADDDLDSYSINLSGASLSDIHFNDFIAEQFALATFDIRRISFEITETDAVKSLVIASSIIRNLKGFGCKISLDDFGSGVSSFSYLLELNIDQVKIDGVFVRDLAAHAANRAIVRSVVDIARTLNISTVAEYVENQETLDELQRLGVDYAQGYGLHVPEPLLPKERSF